ncbi:MAG: hypothetical protein AAF845_02460 [Bacteroidota bacterium]
MTGTAQSAPIEANVQAPLLRTGASATQTVSLSPGVNLVSLYVLPDNPSLDALLGGTDGIRSVSSDDGRVYAPEWGIRTLTAWEGGRTYRIHVDPEAASGLSFEVSGARLEAETALVLREGWNDVAFLHPTALPVDEALTSIAESLNRVEDVDARVYPASGGAPELSTLEPGQGYRIHLSRADTLTLASGAGPSADRNVGTLASALALADLQVGEVVEVAGYSAPGDGGGGRFEVVDTGEAPDGGVVFVPDAFTEEVEAPGLTRSQTLDAGEGIAFESFRLVYGPGDDEYFTATDLHGHGGDRNGSRFLDPASGDLTVPHGALALADERAGTNRVTARYRRATGPIRLQRVIPALRLEGTLTTRYVRPEWWGAQPYPTDWTPDPSAPAAPGASPSGIVTGDPVYDATNALATAINTASIRTEATGQDHYVVLRGMYGYSRVLETKDGAVLKGERDGVRDGQGLRVLKGAPWKRFSTASNVDPQYAEAASPYDRIVRTQPQVVIRHGRQATLGRLVDLEIDGNLAENTYVFTDEYLAASGPSNGQHWGSRVEEMLQNSTHWNGFVASTSLRDGVVGSNARLENVHIHDTGGNLILGGASNVHFGGSRDLRLGNSARNHGLYGVRTAEGTSIDNIEVYGFWWNGFIPMQMGHYNGVTVRDLVPNPHFGSLGNFLGHRNPSDLDDLGDPETDFYFGETTLIEDFRIELPDGIEMVATKYHRGPYALRGVTLASDNDRPFNLVAAQANDLDNQTERSHHEVADVTVERGKAWAFMAGHAMRADVRGLTVSAPASPGGSYSAFGMRPHSPDHVYSVYDVQPSPGEEPYSSNELFVINPLNTRETTSMDLYVQRVRLHSGKDIIHVKKLDTSDPEVWSRFRVFIRDAEFNRFNLRNDDRSDRRHGYRLCYFERVTVGARTSEDSGPLESASLTAAGDGTGFVDIDLNLFHRPYEAVDGGGGLVEVTGAAADRYLGYENVGTQSAPVLRLSFSGTAPVSGTWRAAVRPIPDDVVFPE